MTWPTSRVASTKSTEIDQEIDSGCPVSGGSAIRIGPDTDLEHCAFSSGQHYNPGKRQPQLKRDDFWELHQSQRKYSVLYTQQSGLRGGSITVKAAEFTPTTGPKIASGNVTYVCSAASVGTACSGTQTLSTTATTRSSPSALLPAPVRDARVPARNRFGSFSRWQIVRSTKQVHIPQH